MSARFKLNRPKKADPRNCLIESKRQPLPQKPSLFKPQFHPSPQSAPRKTSENTTAFVAHSESYVGSSIPTNDKTPQVSAEDPPAGLSKKKR
jgi:hypothetical protein